MLRFIVRRLLQLIPTLIGLSLLLFIWLRSLPGGPEAALLGDRATPERMAAIREQLGLNDSIWVQYGRFVKKLVQLDFGNSLQRGAGSVTEEFFRRFPATVELALTAMLIAIVVGIPLGYLAARRRGGFLDFGAVAGSLLGICVPVFFLGFLLKVFFAENLQMFPSAGRLTAGLEYNDITGLLVFDSLITGDFMVLSDALAHLILPGLTLASIPLAIIVRMTRASVLEVLGEDYVRTAESKGLKAKTIRTRHVLRNAMLPVVTTIGLLTGGLLSGAVLTETVFAFGGIGKFTADAIAARDYPTLNGFIMFIAVIYVLINLLVDVAYSVLDPRVRVH
ncbi:ABC transporter permease [Stackebrandtia nassauensis]|uniref:Binding-protein-dependent transport systems inner membrane component n=1 Tax=Stackebrandtia nassauensis (strain DSM 44728 / CIP 108903 / NRRL B-16338 / NBRC 102104 / LLR-40K-21) TaxID=446470 RepID=D3Q2M2_STANL|nr:ABC transporter permease [Stackebrandtia nassauensis]ADD45773.1 binding-protein-dependent transport systems inner membrane component [Stackebrandtia nassauensis DSM 44728]